MRPLRVLSLPLGIAAALVLTLVVYLAGHADKPTLAEYLSTKTSMSSEFAQQMAAQSSWQGAETGPASFASSATSPNCRYGVATWVALVNWLPKLGAGWYLDFIAHAPAGVANIEYVQVVRIKQNKNNCTYLPGYTTSPTLTQAGLGSLVQAYPGMLWLVGNEPDRGPDPDQCTGGQDDTFPDVYAQAYHDVYQFIKQYDPTAQIGIAGLVEVTPGRLQYLDKVWQAYFEKYNVTMPVDVWNMHLYILSEAEADGKPDGIANVALGTDPALAMRQSGGNASLCSNQYDNVYCWAEHDNMTIFAQQIVAMRTWMKQHGQQNKPLILSEYSILFPSWMQDEYGAYFTQARTIDFMTKTFNYLENTTDPNLGYPVDSNRLVQQWMWFSMYYTGAGEGSNLLTSTLTSLTQVGKVFSTTVHNQTTYADLVPGRVANGMAFAPAPGEAATATLSADIYNHGNTWSTAPITVTFYSSSDLTPASALGSAVITRPVSGCGRPAATVTTTWANLESGVHYYWVKVEGDGSRTADNVASGSVMVNPVQVYLPIAMR